MAALAVSEKIREFCCRHDLRGEKYNLFFYLLPLEQIINMQVLYYYTL
jgi:hypothetical protein